MALQDAVQLATTSHVTAGGSNPTYGYDSDFGTAHSDSASGTDGSSQVTLSAEHTFDSPKTITKFVCKLYAKAAASGQYGYGVNVAVYMQYYDGSWHDVPGTRYSSGSSGGSGSTSATADLGVVTVEGEYTNVTAVKVVSYASAHAGGGEGTYSTENDIYECQAFYIIKRDYAGVI